MKIVGFETRKSSLGDKFVVSANFETKPMPEEGGKPFEGWEDAKGQIGRAQLSIYTTGSDNAWQEFLNKTATIADSMGLTNQLNTLEPKDLEDYLNKLKVLFDGKYVWFFIGGEEYEKDGKIKEVIIIPRFNYVAPTEAELKAKQKGGEWPDKTNTYVFKALTKMDADEVGSGGVQPKGSEENDLPF